MRTERDEIWDWEYWNGFSEGLQQRRYEESEAIKNRGRRHEHEFNTYDECFKPNTYDDIVGYNGWLTKKEHIPFPYKEGFKAGAGHSL